MLSYTFKSYNMNVSYIYMEVKSQDVIHMLWIMQDL